MSEKIGLARAEIVDLLSLILRTHSRDELFSLFRSAEGITPKEDPEAWREDCRKRQAAGVKFQRKSCGEWLHPINMFDFSGNKEDYREVPQYEMQIEQPAIGVISSFNKWDRVLTEKEISDLFSGKVRPEDIPQEAPKIKEIGIEPQPVTPHAAERALWKAQREVGTNEVWQVLSGNGVANIRVDVEPNWHPDFIYRTKPMKLTAKICRVGKAYPMSYSGQDWEFFGTREEYRAECEKYGYVVVSEIKEVVEKPKTVKYYFALCKTPDGYIGAKFHEDKQRLTDWIITCCGTIIGDIEEREIEA